MVSKSTHIPTTPTLSQRVILRVIDLVMLQHKFEIENKDGSKEVRTSTLCEYGAPIGSGGYSAMAKLVGVPCGIGKSSHSRKFLRHRHVKNRHTPLLVASSAQILHSWESIANVSPAQLSNRSSMVLYLTRAFLLQCLPESTTL